MFFLDTDEANGHDQPPPHVAEWMQSMEGEQWGSLPLRQWENIYWPAPQQANAQDCAIGVMAFMIDIVRGWGLPQVDPMAQTSAPRAVYNAGSLTHMRSRFVAMLAAADQPRYNFNNRIMAKA